MLSAPCSCAGDDTCSISGMCLWRDTPYAFMPSATSVYRKACFTERPAPLTPLFASMIMSSCSSVACDVDVMSLSGTCRSINYAFVLLLRGCQDASLCSCCQM